MGSESNNNHSGIVWSSSLLRELNVLLSTKHGLNTTDMANNKISYVRVPQTKSDRSFLNSKEWLDTAIEISGSKAWFGRFVSGVQVLPV